MTSHRVRLGNCIMFNVGDTGFGWPQRGVMECVLTADVSSLRMIPSSSRRSTNESGMGTTTLFKDHFVYLGYQAAYWHAVAAPKESAICITLICGNGHLSKERLSNVLQNAPFVFIHEEEQELNDRALSDIVLL